MPGVGLLQYELQRDYPELSFRQIRHLIDSYGFLARDVCGYIRKSPELAKPLVEDDDSLPWIKAEVVYGIRYLPGADREKEDLSSSHPCPGVCLSSCVSGCARA